MVGNHRLELCSVEPQSTMLPLQQNPHGGRLSSRPYTHPVLFLPSDFHLFVTSRWRYIKISSVAIGGSWTLILHSDNCGVRALTIVDYPTVYCTSVCQFHHDYISLRQSKPNTFHYLDSVLTAYRIPLTAFSIPKVLVGAWSFASLGSFNIIATQ